MPTWKLIVATILMAVPVWAGEHWPQFRGPEGNGHSDATGLPITWSETQNVVWKTAIHDLGWSSPVVWGNQIWMTTATTNGREMFAVCVDLASGKVIHDVKVFDTPAPEHVASMNSYASPTPVVEAGRLYVHYGTYGIACLDTGTAKVIWSRRDLKCDHHEGPGSSPMVCGNLLIVHVDGRDVQYVIALDKSTGQTVWKTDRSINYSAYGPNERKAFCTPIVIESDGGKQLISPGAKAVMGYDPATGRELWKVRYNGWSVTPRPLSGQGLLFIITDYERPELWAIKPGGNGDVTGSHVAWKMTKGAPSRPCMLLIDDLLYMVSSDGMACCVEARSGQLVWKQRLAGSYSASPIYADGRIYFFSHEAVATVIQPGREYKLLATNEFDRPQELMASPAVVGKALLVRTKAHLYRIEKGD
ncbi:MAG: PQQ-binding-like beta-propeller repeat protein [Tepidisphaerales bacterium]